MYRLQSISKFILFYCNERSNSQAGEDGIIDLIARSFNILAQDFLGIEIFAVTWLRLVYLINSYWCSLLG